MHVVLPFLYLISCTAVWSLQPRAVITVESHPARKVMGSLSFPEGSPWCGGRPTYWLVGHQSVDESPWCLDRSGPITDYSNLTWTQNSPALLDRTDPLNDKDGPKTIDRHDCTALDVDGSGSLDIVCGVGANKGTGFGYNELYLTADDETSKLAKGSVRKILKGHGLHKYATMRNRIAVTLHDPFGVPLVFLAVQGAKRADGKPNTHRMFRLQREGATDELSSLAPSSMPTNAPTGNPTLASPTPSITPTSSPTGNETAINSTVLIRDRFGRHVSNQLSFHDRKLDDGDELAFFFEEVKPSPWKKHTKASCARAVDLNQDGIDDLVLCNTKKQARLFIQDADGRWESLDTVGGRASGWRNARVADVTGDGIVDMIVVGYGGRSVSKPVSYLRVFEGSRDPPFFEFRKRGMFYEIELPYASPDLELLDVNNDGLTDIYVVQTDEITNGTYCAGTFKAREWWDQGNQPPTEFAPPPDMARDLLLMGTLAKSKFEVVEMTHSKPGCGGMVQKFGSNQTLLLAQGTASRPGHNLLLQW